MIKDTKTRVIITIPQALVDDINVLCDQMGLTKSAFISMAVGEKVMAYKKSFELASEILRTSPVDLIKPIS